MADKIFKRWNGTSWDTYRFQAFELEGHPASYFATATHTHTTSLAVDTGTSAITLAYGGKYKLTAGGSTVIFTMPASDNTNTWRPVGTGASDAAAGNHSHGNISNGGQVSATESTTANVKHILVTVDDNGTIKKMTPANVRTAIGAAAPYSSTNKLDSAYITNNAGWTTNTGTVTSVSAGTGLSISGTASTTPKVEIASGYKLPTTTEWTNKSDSGHTHSYAGSASAGGPANNITYTTTAPTANNTDGLKICVLSSDPATKYTGWLYIITG